MRDKLRVLICGSRDWDSPNQIEMLLDGLLLRTAAADEKLVVIEGCARGADNAAHLWGVDGKLLKHRHFPANWDLYGKRAGPIRNQEMLTKGRPHVVYAFSDDLEASRGTRDMVTRAQKAGLPVYLMSRPPRRD